MYVSLHILIYVVIAYSRTDKTDLSYRFTIVPAFIVG